MITVLTQVEKKSSYIIVLCLIIQIVKYINISYIIIIYVLLIISNANNVMKFKSS